MADTLDVLTLAEAKEAINNTSLDATLVAKLERFVTGVSRKIDEICGPVVVRAVTERHSGGCHEIKLRETPVSSVTTVVEWDTGGTSTSLSAEDDDTKPSDGFLLVNHHKHDARILRRSGGGTTLFTAGVDNIVVTMQAGRYATTAAVDPLFKLQAQDILAFQWQQSSPVWATSPGGFDEIGAYTARPFLSIDDMIRRRFTGELPTLVG